MAVDTLSDPRWDQSLAVRLLRDHSIAFINDPNRKPAADHVSEHVGAVRAVFVEEVSASLQKMIAGAKSEHKDDLLWAAGYVAAALGYFLATGHDHYCIDCVTSRAQIVVNALSMGFSDGLDAIKGSGGRKPDGSLNAH